MASYFEEPKEERLNQLEEFKKKKVDGLTLEQKIISLCGSDCPVDSIFWELIPHYFESKISINTMLSVHLITNVTGDQIKILVFCIDIISTDQIDSITASLDLINFSISDDWEPFSFEKEGTSIHKEGQEVIKYIFKSWNLTINSNNLCNQNSFFIKDY